MHVDLLVVVLVQVLFLQQDVKGYLPLHARVAVLAPQCLALAAVPFVVFLEAPAGEPVCLLDFVSVMQVARLTGAMSLSSWYSEILNLLIGGLL